MKEQETKYYTPSIEEFHVGFEVEAKVFDEWFPFIIQEVPESVRNYHKEGLYRVKCLDKEDIESLGFIWNEFHDAYVYRNFKIEKLKDLYIIRNYFAKVDTLFRGVIKNKSELKVLLKQLNIVI